MFDDATKRAIAARARAMRVEPAALLAVAEVESGGRVSARVNGRDEPLIRFEGHYFLRLLPVRHRSRAVREGLASTRAGAVANPRSQVARWQMLERARTIDRVAADSSVSWGLGQVMGSHWRRLGYGSVSELVADARSGVAGQVRLMARFIEREGLDASLRRRDWRHFARRYNGPAYARNRYHERMERAYDRHVREGANAIETSAARRGDPLDRGASKPSPARRWIEVRGARPTLAVGMRGEAVRRVQRVLGLRGDGLYGRRTRDAVRRFQAAKGLREDGIVGARSWALIERREARQWLRARLLAPFRRFGRWVGGLFASRAAKR